jgi:hypothetical protein
VRTPARWLAAALACTVIGLACADTGDVVGDLENSASRSLALGQPCGPTAPCPQGQSCSRGVCCDTPCDGACWSCLASEKADGSPNGTCGPSALGKKPLGECYPHGQFPVQECDASTCNGFGVCAKPADTDCAPTCYGDSLVQPDCGPSGQCSTGTISTCGAYSCDVNSCFTNCDEDDDTKCAAGNWCRDGACIPPQENGKGCTKNQNCKTGFCVEGVCCSSACSEPCHSCLAAKKSSGPNGQCGEVLAGTDPTNRCANDAVNPCGQNGLCDAGGQCALASSSIACGGTPTCAPATVLGGTAKVTGLLCDGAGDCKNSITTTDCTGYSLCTPAGQCPQSCTASAQCATGYSCYDADGNPAAKECAKQIVNGNCTAHDQCVSGKCYDNTCCDEDCADPCQNCLTGKCELTTGDPVGTKSDGSPKTCPGAANGEPCFARRCDGLSTECIGYVGAETSCGVASCTDGTRTLAGTCDGTGHCKQEDPISCGGFACDGVGCKKSCNTNDDCETGAVCDSTKKTCAKGSYCSGEAALTDLNGTVTDCSPYRCVGGACLEACTSNDLCAAGYLCDHASRNCVIAGVGDDPEPPSFWCTAHGSRRSSTNAIVLGVALGMTIALRRSRRR